MFLFPNGLKYRANALYQNSRGHISGLDGMRLSKDSEEARNSLQ